MEITLWFMVEHSAIVIWHFFPFFQKRNTSLEKKDLKKSPRSYLSNLW